MPLEIAPGAHAAMGPNPPERRLSPLIGPGRPESLVNTCRMSFEVVDQGGGGHDTAFVDRISLGLTGDDAT